MFLDGVLSRFEPCFAGAAAGLVAAKEMKLGAFAKPVRAALTGSTASPSLFEVIWAVGRPEVLARLRDAAEGKFKVLE